MFFVLANVVVLSHVAFVVFVFLGARLLKRFRWLVYLHASCLLYAVVITVVGWPCPLTVLEQWLLAEGGLPVYSGEFLPHYVWSHVGLRGDEVALGARAITEETAC